MVWKSNIKNMDEEFNTLAKATNQTVTMSNKRKINLEETKLITDDLNKIIIPMGDPHINNRKNSAGAESYSTCDEMSPEKLQNNNKKKTFPKKNKKTM